MSSQIKKTGKTISLTYLAISLFIGSQSVYSQNKNQLPTQSILWEISGNNLVKPSYIFGTIHLYDKDVFQLPKKVLKTLNKCNFLLLEVDFDKVNQFAFIQRIKIQSEDSTLDKLLSYNAFEKLKQLPSIKMMGIDEVKKYNPFFTSSFLLIEDVNAPLQSIDMELHAYAKKHAKHIIGLETIDEQLDAIDAIPLTNQVQMLEEYLLKFTTPKEELNNLLNAYKNQDFDYFEKEIEKSFSNPLFSEKLINERNIKMANKIDSILTTNKKDELFAAVGAAHINDTENAKGLVGLLREKGYTLTPIKIEFK